MRRFGVYRGLQGAMAAALLDKLLKIAAHFYKSDSLLREPFAAHEIA